MVVTVESKSGDFVCVRNDSGTEDFVPASGQCLRLLVEATDDRTTVLQHLHVLIVSAEPMPADASLLASAGVLEPLRGPADPDHAGTSTAAVADVTEGSTPMKGRKQKSEQHDTATAEEHFSLECRLRYQHGVIVPPGPQTGPEALLVPLTGHEIVLTLAPRGSPPVWISGIAATIDGYESSESAQPVVAEAELRPPHFVIHLDNDPPGMAPTPKRDGGIPPTPDGGAELLIAPVTAESRLVCWRLWVRVSCGEDEVRTRGFPLRTTAVSHWTRFRPGGARPQAVPAAEMATGHWHPPRHQ